MTKEVMHPKAAAMEQLSFSASAGQTALAHLCGPLDENLRQMETILGVKIVRRGEQFRVSGEKHAAHRALRALEVLLDRVARTGAELTPNDIQWHFVGGDDEHRAKTANADEVSAGEVLLKTRRHDLRGRTPNQRAYLQAILSHDISFGIGPAGTGKTYLAVAAAVDAFERGTVERIVLTRPAVEAGERLGFLPGDLSQKVDPYLRPLYDALFDLMGFDKVRRLMERQSIEVAPLAYMRGRTLNNAFVILDEAQNTTGEQMKMFLTRLGFNSQIVVTGDASQVDLPGAGQSGLAVISKCSKVFAASASRTFARVMLCATRWWRALLRLMMRQLFVMRLNGAQSVSIVKQKERAPQKRTCIMHELTLHLQQAGLFKDKLPHRSTMARWIRAALELDGEFTVRFVDEEEGRELNHQFRRKDYATNVLTFDYQREPVVMADIVICPAVLERQAAEQQKPLRDHLAHLLIHGVLHAQGYDHLDDEEAEVMEARETEIMESLGFPNPYSDRIGMVHD